MRFNITFSVIILNALPLFLYYNISLSLIPNNNCTLHGICFFHIIFNAVTAKVNQCILVKVIPKIYFQDTFGYDCIRCICPENFLCICRI